MADYLKSYEIVRNNIYPVVDDLVPVLAGGPLVYNPGVVVVNMIPSPAGGTRKDDVTNIATRELAGTLNAGAQVVTGPPTASAFAAAAIAYMSSTPTEPPPDGDGVLPLYIARGLGATLVANVASVVSAVALLIIGPPPIPVTPVTLAPVVQGQWNSLGAVFALKSMHADAAIIRFVTSIFSGGS